MGRLNPQKLHVRFEGVKREIFVLPRRYTLTHSDKTGDLFLTIASDFDNKQISGWQTRFMRDEVLAEWKTKQGTVCLHVYCHVSGGFVFGTDSLRESIFRREMPLVLEAIRYGEGKLIEKNSSLDQAEVLVHFEKARTENCLTESWGLLSNYKIS
jgi:hypothetical protein